MYLEFFFGLSETLKALTQKLLFFKRVDSTKIGLNYVNHREARVHRVRIENSVELELNNMHRNQQEQIKFLKYCTKKPFKVHNDSLIKQNTPTTALIQCKIEII